MSATTHACLDRRRFVTATAALSLGLIVPSACAGEGGLEQSDAEGSDGRTHAADGGGLPPRVVGLRSLGGKFRFDPEGLLVEPGSDVHWLNMGDFHTVTAFHPANDKLIPPGVTLRIPEGAEPFHSGILGLTAGTQFTHRFDVEGVYDYFCQPHYSFGMVGRVVVVRPGGRAGVGRPADELIEVARANLPPVERIVGPAGVAYEWSARVNGVLYEAANGRDAVAAVAAVVDAAQVSELREWVGAGTWPAVRGALEALAAEAPGGDYEALVRRADEVKRLLREAQSNA
jgi:plastocyanin